MNTTILIFTSNFKDLIGEIYTAEVHHVRPRVVILVDDEGNEITKRKTNPI
jgi:N utilization substance protein A